MNDTSLIDLEINLTLLDLLDGGSNIHGNSTTLGVRHQTTGTEDAAQRTNLTHAGRHRDDHIDIRPSTLNFLNILIETYIISTSLLCSCLLIGGAKTKHARYLSSTIGKRNYTAYHLVGLARIYAETYINVEGSIKLDLGHILDQLSCLIQSVCLPCFNLVGH